MSEQHITVLKREAVEYLNVTKDGIYYDATFGKGGHTTQILSHSPKKLISTDKDTLVTPQIIQDNFQFVNSDFVQFLKTTDLTFDGILADFGVSSVQLDTPERGFSFQKDGPLDMRMDITQTKSASTVVNEYSESELVEIFFKYGEEQFSRKIARAIISKRPFSSTLELANLIASVKKQGKERIHPATKVFQAIRIEVNDEIKVIEEFLDLAIPKLNSGGRLVVISFHSLEDRVVKHKFKSFQNPCTCPPKYPCRCGKISLGDIISKKPIIPSDEEINSNPRSRSAKMRVFERKLLLD